MTSRFDPDLFARDDPELERALLTSTGGMWPAMRWGLRGYVRAKAHTLGISSIEALDLALRERGLGPLWCRPVTSNYGNPTFEGQCRRLRRAVLKAARQSGLYGALVWMLEHPIVIVLLGAAAIGIVITGSLAELP